MIYYVIGWVAAGACAAAVAACRGRGFVLWLGLGALLGPLAMAAVCLLPSVAGEESPTAPARRLCPKCSNEIAPSARMCKWCKSIV